MSQTQQTNEDTVTDTAMRPITAHDRCDRCGHAAAIAVEVHGVEFTFCSHHYNDSEAGLAAKGAVITADRRSEIK